MTAPRRRRLAAALATTLLVTIAGCGDDGLPSSSTTGLPPVEVGTPPDTVPTRGVVLLIHGGGWSGPMPALTAQQRPAAKVLQDDGFATVIVDYRAGRQGVQDVLYRVDEAHRAFPHQRMCLFGQSAGAHLALLAAARRPGFVKCVLSHAGPTDLPALREQTRGTPTYGWAVKAFGQAGLERYSPVRYASRIRAKVLQINARNDKYVPVPQATELKRRLRGSRLILLSAGKVPWLHSSVDADQLAKAGAEQLTFIENTLDPPA